MLSSSENVTNASFVLKLRLDLILAMRLSMSAIFPLDLLHELLRGLGALADVLRVRLVVLHGERASFAVQREQNPVVLREHRVHHLAELELEETPHLFLVRRVFGESLHRDGVIADLDRVLVH
jgi:hypothetical protein